MSAYSRNKGARGERELASILSDELGVTIKRRIRQHEGDSDLEGVDGWSIESKNCATLRINAWWEQTVSQALKANAIPVLFYKIPRKGWRAMWPLSVIIAKPELWSSIDYAVDSSVQAWCAVARGIK